MWKLQKEIMVGGLTEIGLTKDGLHVLVVSHNGRGLIRLADGDKIARDYAPVTAGWYRPQKFEADAIGPCQGETVAIWGLCRDTEIQVMKEVHPLKPNEHITEFRAALRTSDERLLILGFSDAIMIYSKKLEN